jgi:hypothetical protein
VLIAVDHLVHPGKGALTRKPQQLVPPGDVLVQRLRAHPDPRSDVLHRGVLEPDRKGCIDDGIHVDPPGPTGFRALLHPGLHLP